jgi:4-hydroxy-tetrahydrodipicolinate synthase
VHSRGLPQNPEHRKGDVVPLTELGTEGTATGRPDRDRWRRVLADVAVVTVTPFRGADLEGVDHQGLARNLDHVLDAGVRLLVAGGNTGEFASLAPREVVDVVRTHARVARGRATVIAGVGYRLEEAVKLGAECVAAGAEALMLHHPIHPYASERGLISYYERIASALPGVPLVLYVRGPQLTAAGARHVAALDSVVGVKMGRPDVARLAEFVAAAPDLAWTCGLAETWAVPFWRAGAVGFTSGLANVAPRRSLDVLAALQSGDDGAAEREVDRLRPFEALRAARDDAANVAVIKASLDALGLAGGGLRPPLSSLEPDERDALIRTLHDMEVLP